MLTDAHGCSRMLSDAHGRIGTGGAERGGEGDDEGNNESVDLVRTLLLKFTCFTSTKVQILTPEGDNESVAFVRSLLALLIQK
jgi:hypothetical protein